MGYAVGVPVELDVLNNLVLILNECELEDKNFVPWIEELRIRNIGFLCLKLLQHFPIIIQ